MADEDDDNLGAVPTGAAMSDIQYFADRYNEFIGVQFRILEELEGIGKTLAEISRKLDKPEKEKKPRPSAKGSPVWEAYMESFLKRHQCQPLRNARNNSIARQLVDRLGEEAVEIARFYPFHPDPFYYRNRHDLSLLLRDAERIRTDWQTRSVVSKVEAEGHARRAGAQNQLDRIKNGEL